MSILEKFQREVRKKSLFGGLTHLRPDPILDVEPSARRRQKVVRRKVVTNGSGKNQPKVAQKSKRAS